VMMTTTDGVLVSDRLKITLEVQAVEQATV
jgi:hypothetical protein